MDELTQTIPLRDEDSAKRMRDAIAVHRLALSNDEIVAGRYIGVRLTDGGTDGQAYESKAEVVKHQAYGYRYVAMRIPPITLSVAACDSLLFWMRCADRNGFRQDEVHEMRLPNLIEEYGR